MRESIICFILLLFNSNLLSQGIKEKLQNNTWQTTVNLTGVAKMTTKLCLKTDTVPDFEIIFTKDNIFHCTEFRKNKEYDVNGKEIIRGSNYFTESCYYIIKKNKIVSLLVMGTFNLFFSLCPFF